MLLAVEAHRMRDNTDSQGALQAALFEDTRYNGTIVDPEATSGTTSLCLTDDGTVIASTADGAVGIYDLETRSLLGDRFRIAEGGGKLNLACDASGTRVAAWNADGDWAWLDTSAAEVAGPVQHADGLFAIAVSSDGSSVALCDDEGTISMLSQDGSEADRAFSAGEGRLGLSLSPDGSVLASVSNDGVDLWDSTSFDSVLHVEPPDSLSAETAGLTDTATDTGQAAFSSDGRLLAVSAGSTLRVVEIETGQVQWSVPTTYYGGSAVEFTDDDRLLAQTGSGFEQRSLDTGDVVGRPLPGTAGLASIATSGQVAVVGPAGGSALTVVRLDGQGPVTSTVTASGSSLIQYHPLDDNILLFAASGDSILFTSLRSVDTTTNELGPPLPAMAMAQPTGPHEIGGLLEGGLTIGFFDLLTGEPTRPEVDVPLDDALGATFDSTTGRLAISRASGTIDLYDDAGAVVASPWATPGGYPWLLDYHFTDEGWIAGGDNDTRRAFVVRSDGRLAFTTEEPLSWPTLSKDGALLAGIDGTGSLTLFDGHEGQPLDIQIELPPGTNFLQFSDDGRRLLATNDTGAVLVDLVSNQVIGDALPASDGWASLRSDGMQVATNTGDGALLLDFDPAHWRDATCELAGRNLTRAEWDRYLPAAGDYRPTCDEWDPAP